MLSKKCTKCNLVKELSEFNVCSRVKDGRKSECRECQKLSQKNYRENNKVKLKKYSDNWNANNKDYYHQYYLNYTHKHKEREKERKSEWFKKNPNYLNEYNKKRKKNDVLFYLRSMMRNSVNRYLKYKSKKTYEIIGCNPEFLKEYLESKFQDGMTWQNRREWHIDHIIPLSSAKSEDELLQLCHYTNLQPLWMEENLKKSNKTQY